MRDGDAGILEDVLVEDLALVQALGLGEFDIVGVHLVDDVTSGPEHEAGDGRHGQRNDRQHPGAPVARPVGGEHRRQFSRRGGQVTEEINICQRGHGDDEDDIRHAELVCQLVLPARHQDADRQTQTVGQHHGDDAHGEGRAYHGGLVLEGFKGGVVVDEFLSVHSVDDGLILQRAEIDGGLRLVSSFEGDVPFHFRSLGLEQHAQHLHALICGVGGAKIQLDNILVKPRKSAVGIQQIFVDRSAADESNAAGGRPSERELALEVGIVLVLHGVGGINDNHL